jgi:surface carbohydrate biosynthesis protein
MNVNIFYENLTTELPGKLFLAAELLKNSKVESVTIGYYKSLFFKLLKEQKYLDNRHNDSIVYKDIWSGSEVFIKIFKLLKFKYYALQQEDYIIFNKKLFTNTSYNIIPEKYFSLIDKFFTLSKHSLDLWKAEKSIQSQKILATGNPRYEYFSECSKKNNKNRDYILLVIPGLLFGINLKFIKIPDIKKLIKNDNFTSNSDYDKLLNYSYNKSLLKFYLVVAKKNPNLSFLLRVYPHEKPYIKYYLRLIKNIKNIKISCEESIIDALQKTYLTISTCDNVCLESSMLGIKTYVYKRNKIIHNYMFGDHLFLKLYPNNIIGHKNYNSILNNKDKNYVAQNAELKQLYGLNLKSSKLITDVIIMNNIKKNNNFFNIKYFFTYYALILFIKKIIFFIEYDKKNNLYNVSAFEKFKNNFKYSFTRIFFYFLFFDLKNIRHNVHNIIYKYMLGKNYHETPADIHKSISFNINIDYIYSFFKDFNLFDLKKITTSLNQEKDILVFKKIL